MCSYNNILTKRKHQFHARSQKSGSKLLAPTVLNSNNSANFNSTHILITIQINHKGICKAYTIKLATPTQNTD